MTVIRYDAPLNYADFIAEIKYGDIGISEETATPI